MTNKKKRLQVSNQEVREISGWTGAYEAYVGEGREEELANPDLLPEQHSGLISNPRRLMGEAIEHLQGRQREVYLLVMREERSIDEAGELLGIAKGTAQTYLTRAIKFITAYCKQAVDGGRV